jgi:protein phosphatase
MTQYTMIGMTDPGMVRTENEDSIATLPEAGLAILADGMGGHQAGEVASRMAVDNISRLLTDTYAANRDQPAPERIGDSIRRANAQIHQTARSRPECAGMGSTIVTALFRGDTLTVGHVGDSRLYRLRADRFEQLTEDHSVIQELVNRGLYTREEARQSVGKNLVTRALGVDPEVQVDVGTHATEAGDIYLLCSDGLNDVVSDEDIVQVLNHQSNNLYSAAFHLVALANQRGGPDNISVILVRREPDPAPVEEPASGNATADDEFQVSRHDKFLVDD